MDEPVTGMGISEHRSLWQERSRASAEGSGVMPTETDVCVVGAGIAGLTTAYCLAREGRRVTVIDARPIGSGETGLSTAHLASALDDGFQSLERAHGEDGMKLAVKSHADAIDFIGRTAAAESIECGFKRLNGYLFLDAERSPRFLERELEAARRAGLEVEQLDVLPIPTLAPGPALSFGHQGQCDPSRYLLGLARACIDRGVTIHIGLRAERFEGGDPCRVTLEDGRTIAARAVVVATNTPVNERVRLHTKQMAYRSYAVALEVERGAVPDALFWDTADPYHYVRLADLDPEGTTDLLIVGGEDHRTGTEEDPEARWEALLDWARPRFPAAGALRHRWSGQILEPVDGLAFIGRSPDGEKNIYVATGDSGHGMTHGTIAGELIANLIQGRDDPRAALFDPRRWSLRGLPSWVMENLETAAHYLDWASVGRARDEVSLEPGEGMIVRRGMKRLAIARDDGGEYHVLSAVCTHLGGMVHWNPAERSWDCPCHGSRFDACGAVINGPANKNLERIDPSDAPVLIAPSRPLEEVAASGMIDLAAPMSAMTEAQGDAAIADAATSSFSGQRSDVPRRSRAHEGYAAGAEPRRDEPRGARPTIEPPRIIPFPGVTPSSKRGADPGPAEDVPSFVHEGRSHRPSHRPTIEPPRSKGPGQDALPSFGRSGRQGDQDLRLEPQGTFDELRPFASSTADRGSDELEDTDRFEPPVFSFVEEPEDEVSPSPAAFEGEMPSFASVGKRKEAPGEQEGDDGDHPIASERQERDAASASYEREMPSYASVAGEPEGEPEAASASATPEGEDLLAATGADAGATEQPIDLLVPPPVRADADAPQQVSPPARPQMDYDEYDEEDVTTHPSRSNRRQP